MHIVTSGQTGQHFTSPTCVHNGGSGTQRTVICISKDGVSQSILGGINSDSYGHGNGMYMCATSETCGTSANTIEIFYNTGNFE